MDSPSLPETKSPRFASGFPHGAVEDLRPLACQCSLALPRPDGSVLFQRDDALIYRGADGGEQLLPLAAPLIELSPMGDSWVQIQTRSGRPQALRLAPALQLFELPEVAQ